MRTAGSVGNIQGICVLHDPAGYAGYPLSVMATSVENGKEIQGVGTLRPPSLEQQKWVLALVCLPLTPVCSRSTWGQALLFSVIQQVVL